MSETLYVLAGPTASGKTEYAIRFAERHNCEILSCDASAFYKRMDIGTAKPSKEEQRLVPHWGLDLTEPNEYFSIHDYLHYAQRCIGEIFNRNHNVLVVGGSGFYLKSFFAPVVDEHRLDKSVAQQVEMLSMEGGPAALLQALVKLHPHGLPAFLDIQNPVKLKKALIRCLSTGLNLQELQVQFQQMRSPFQEVKKQTILLVWPIELLKLRVQYRVQHMLLAGLIQEVQQLLENHYLRPHTPASNAIGYRESIEFLTQTNQTDSDFAHLKEQIIKNTYQLIKKQNTWFRHQIPIDHFHYCL